MIRAEAFIPTIPRVYKVTSRPLPAIERGPGRRRARRLSLIRGASTRYASGPYGFPRRSVSSRLGSVCGSGKAKRLHLPIDGSSDMRGRLKAPLVLASALYEGLVEHVDEPDERSMTLSVYLDPTSSQEP
jgi:hypothetical protein